MRIPVSSGGRRTACAARPGDADGRVAGTLPRIGVELTLPGELDGVRWYGRGPGECYIDSRQASAIGVYSARVDELFTNYVVPQENGNRCDVRWVRITRRAGRGLRGRGREPMQFSAHRYTTEDLAAARRTRTNWRRARRSRCTSTTGRGPRQRQLRPGPPAPVPAAHGAVPIPPGAFRPL